VIVRYVDEDESELIEQEEWTKVYYVLDDMLPIAEGCLELPAAYRQRLARFAHHVLPRILALSPIVVAPSPAILDLFPGRPRLRLDPCLLQEAADLSHFDAVKGPRAPLKLAFLGTRSHGAGIDFLASALVDLAGRLPEARTTLFFGKHLPPALRRLGRIDNRQPLDWQEFRRFLAQERFHILLAPLPDTPFNAGRSITKILDAAAVGACGLYSDRRPFRGIVANGENGLLLPDDPSLWVGEIVRLAEDHASARRMAEAGAALARRLGDSQRLRRFWLERLGLARQATAV
jgi:glycosyltransferase involved in cell wall biosynthesis